MVVDGEEPNERILLTVVPKYEIIAGSHLPFRKYFPDYCTLAF